MASSSPVHEELNSFSSPEETTQRPPPVPDETLAGLSPNLDSSGTGYSISSDQLRYVQVHPAEQDGEESDCQLNPPFPLLMDIAGAIHNREQCIRLAVKLNLGEDEVLKVLAERFTVKMPLNILSMWIDRYRHHATGPVLHAALCEMERVDLADRFENELLGQGDDRAQSVVEQTPPLQSVDTEAADISQMRPSLDVLVEIAFSLPKLKHCVRLAENLDLGEEFVGRMRAGVFTTDTAALNVLCKWRQQRSREATGRALFDALVVIRQRDIAACFAGKLLGTEEDDWQEFCFDNEHRDFFRTLRRRHIDVVAAHECMCCSEKFLNHLYHWGIIERSEYEDFLSSSHSLLRSNTNKKLLNVMNKKPPQLQKMFADLLCRYQPQLVTGDEDRSTASLDGSHQLTDLLTDSPWHLHGENLLMDFKDELRRWFNQLVIARPLDFVACEDFQPVSEIYVTLSSVSYEEALKLVSGPKQLRGSELLKATSHVAAESKHSKELLDLHSLLRYPQGMQAKSALLFGSAGSGKSLTVLKILSEWNSQNSTSPFTQFDVIVHITGRERARLKSKEVQDLWQLWQMGYNEQQQQFIISYYTHHSEKVLFLVDAWDEAGEEGLLQEDTVVKKILRGDLFRQSSVIITSRPAPSAYPLLEDCKRRYSLVGFNNKRLRELFNRRLEEPQASRLYEMLSQPGYLHLKSAVQKTPLFAAMLVQLNKMEETLPISITTLYQSMLDCIRSRYVQRVRDMQFGSQSKAMTFDKRSTTMDFDQVEAKLGKLALAGWMSNRVSFTEEEASSCGKAVIKPQFGLLSEVKEIGVRGSRVLYHFNHQTWQEYLAARSLAADPDFVKKLRMCLRSVRVGEHTQLFWRFVGGLVDSHLVPILVFEVVKATGIAELTPWETEIRLFLLECVAEHIRAQQVLVQEFVVNQYIRLAAEMITGFRGGFDFSGCVLDANRLSALALVLRWCANIFFFHISGSHVDHHCPSLATALDHLKYVAIGDISHKEAHFFVANILSSLAGSSSIKDITFSKTTFTRECLSAFAQLINNSKSLTKICISRCEFGLSGIAFLSRTIRQSSSLSELTFVNERLAGAGGVLGDVCSQMPHLQSLQVNQCRLGNSDMAGLLVGLQNCWYLRILMVTGNLLTDDVAVPLTKYAVHRVYAGEQVQVSVRERLPKLGVCIAANQLSEDTIRSLADCLPMNCQMVIDNGQLHVEPCSITQIDHALLLQHKMSISDDGHLRHCLPGTSDHGAVQIAQFLMTGYGHLLTSLALAHSGIGDHGAAAIAAAVNKTRLEGLDLSDNLMTFCGFYQLISALPGQSTLRYLNLGRNPIFVHCSSFPGQSMSSILKLSRSVHCLEIVGVDSTQFSDEIDCFENSPLALMAIPSLSALDLSNNAITDKSIAMVTEWMDKVSYLSLSGNKITSHGGRTLVNKAQVLLEGASGRLESGCCLQRIWLGGNNIEESVFADCRCEIISSESFSLEHMDVRHVFALFSSSAATSVHYSDQLPLETTGQCVHPQFWVRMNKALQSNAFLSLTFHLIEKHEMVLLNYCLTLIVEVLANSDGSSKPGLQARTLMNLWKILCKWYTEEENMVMLLAVECCQLAIIDEVALTCSLTSLVSEANQTVERIAILCSVDSNLPLTVEYLSGLAERYRQRHLHSVADQLLQQLECVSRTAQFALGDMQLLFP